MSRRRQRISLITVLFLVGYAIGLVAAADSSVTVTVGYTIMVEPFVELTVLNGEAVEFGLISTPGTYPPSAGTLLGLRSNRDWLLTDTFLLEASTYPDGADTATMGNTLSRSYQNSGGPASTWIEIDVDYLLTLSQENLDNLPNGDYRLIIQFTATTVGP
jgi:hypothetical protein